ncbi:MAG: hypothetical protein HY820_25880 [Acidobacteria bacterium]|nr:hypothetical protein [Acidobacteriota bacterium]
MSQSDLARISVADFLERFRAEMIPLSNTFCYFFAGLPLSEEDVKEYLEEPIAALPPAVVTGIPKSFVTLVPYLEKANGKRRHGVGAPGTGEFIHLDKPSENKACTSVCHRSQFGVDMVFAVKDVEMADYHYFFYHQIAALTETALPDHVRAEYQTLVGEELNERVHGEVDEPSWKHKQALPRRRTATVRRDTKAFREYARLSFIDTMTLYLHGICCDIDVETGPRQLPSRFLRKRLVWLETIFPPPEGYAVFPEELEPEPPPRS